MDLLYKILFYIFLFIMYFVLATLFFRYYYILVKKIKPIKDETNRVRVPSLLKRIFYLFPKQLAYDKLTHDPNTFSEYGFHLICGKQGKGKTITLVYLLLQYKERYPKLKIRTNMLYKYEDEPLNNWEDIVFSNNGIYGEIDVIDETQNWFNSMQSKDFPPAMLQEITQQRKQRKMIIGTSQVFTRVAKPIRENVYMLYQPITLFGCVTICFKYEPDMDTDGVVDKKKFRGCFMFVHNKKIRDAFDTYHKICIQAQQGFISNNIDESNNQININVDTSAKRKSLFKK